MSVAEWVAIGQYIAVGLIIVACVLVVLHRVSDLPESDDDDSDQFGC